MMRRALNLKDSGMHRDIDKTTVRVPEERV
jgi:hypothetical protein